MQPISTHSSKTVNTNPRFVFFGTPEFAVTILNELHKHGLTPGLIVTAPDKPKGRGLTVTPPPVKVWAQDHTIQIIQPDTLRGDIPKSLTTGAWDFFVVAAYGKILPKALLDIPPQGTLNVHPSLLPKYRGASPIETQILYDEQDVGVSIMLMDEEMDHGPILSAEIISLPSWPIRKDELSRILAVEGGRMLAETISSYISGTLTPLPQDHTRATVTKKIAKQDGEIDFAEKPYTNFLKFCAYHPWPGTFFFTKKNEQKTRIKITEARFHNGKFIPTRVVPEGKEEIQYDTLTALGYTLPPEAPEE